MTLAVAFTLLRPVWLWVLVALYTALYLVARNAAAKTIPPIPEWNLEVA